MLRIAMALLSVLLMIAGWLTLRPFDIRLARVREVVPYIRNRRNPARARWGVLMVNASVLLIVVNAGIGILTTLSD